VKYPEKLVTGLLKAMVMKPPLSERILVPECGGNSNSLSEIPTVRMIALVKVSPEYCVVTTVPSARPSKLMVDPRLEF
jgi:hypothetical protein